MRKFIVGACVVLATLTQPVLAEKKPKDKAPYWRLMSYRLIDVGEVLILAGVFKDGAYAQVCGAYFVADGKSSATIQARANEVAAQLYYQIDGRTLDISTAKFKGYATKDELLAADAATALGCSTSHRKLQDIKNPSSFTVRTRHGGIKE